MRALRGILAGLLGLALFLATTELAVRVLRPVPRVQVVRPEHVGGLHDLDGVITWEQPVSAERRAVGCQPGDRTVLLVGSSITWGTGVEADQNLGARLLLHLETPDDPWCVRNVAEPAFSGEQKLVTGRRAVEAYAPDVVVWEVWTNDAGHFVRIGPAAANVGELRVDDDGLPSAFPVPAAAHRALLAHSRAWAYLHLSLAPPDAAGARARFDHYVRDDLAAVRAQVEAGGGRLIVALASELDRPFGETAARHRDPEHRYAALLADPGGLEVIDLATALAGRDVRALRQDTCCHLAPPGNDAVAEVIADRIRAGAPAPVAAEAP